MLEQKGHGNLHGLFSFWLCYRKFLIFETKLIAAESEAPGAEINS